MRAYARLPARHVRATSARPHDPHAPPSRYGAGGVVVPPSLTPPKGSPPLCPPMPYGQRQATPRYTTPSAEGGRNIWQFVTCRP